MSQEIKGAKGVKMYAIQDEMITSPSKEALESANPKLPIRQNFDFLYTDLPKKKDKPCHLIVGKRAWMDGVAESYGLTQEEAQEALEKASKSKSDRLLFEYDPNTGQEKDKLKIYLIGEYEQ